MKNILLILFAGLLIAACEKETVQIEQPIIEDDSTQYILTQAEIEDSIIQQYIADSNLNAQAGTDGLYYVIEVQGSGDSPDSSSVVTVTYKGYRIDGFVIDETTTPYNFHLPQLIAGWKQGLLYFKEGGKGTLIIPSHLAYGEIGLPPKIPPNSIILFDIELFEVH